MLTQPWQQRDPQSGLAVSIKCAEGFVKQQQPRPRRERARKCDDLPFTSGELRRQTIAERLNSQQVQQSGDAPLLFLDSEPAQAEAQISFDRKVREKSASLGQEADAPRTRWDMNLMGSILQRTTFQSHKPLRCRNQPRQNAQQRAFPCA